MKGIDIFCSSRASTAICLSIDSNNSCIVRHGGIDPHSSNMRKPLIPASLPKNHKTNPPHKRNKHHSSSFSSTKDIVVSGNKVPQKTKKYANLGGSGSRHILRDFTVNIGRNRNKHTSSLLSQELIHDHRAKKKTTNSEYKRSTSSSTTYLLEDHDGAPDVLPVVGVDNPLSALVPTRHSAEIQKLSKVSPASRTQVVVLKVSIHCRGCEMKVRKHISRMEGVSSYTIDLATKKVTIVGDVSPSFVLESVSRVKNAQLWASTDRVQPDTVPT